MLVPRIVLVALLLTPIAGAQVAQLQYARNPANAHWYGTTFAPTTWPNGVAAAGTVGGYLASVGSAAEQSWIQTTLTPYASWRYWIGLNDIAVEGQYVWSNGEPLAYTNWGPGQPDNSANEDAVEIQPASSYRWNDLNPATSNACRPFVEVNEVPRVGWTLPQTIGVQTTPGFLDTAHIDNDVFPDVVVPNQGSSSFSVLLGNGMGGLAAAVHTPTASGPVTAVLRDFDGDGDLDVALACSTSNRLRVHFNNGSNSFVAFFERTHVGQGSGLAAADFDGDGLVDLAETTVGSQDRLWIHRNVGGGQFATPVAYATGQSPNFVTAADIDGDVDVDLVVSNFASDDLGILVNQGDGTFTSSALVPRGDGPGRVAVADFNQDGLPDLVVPCRLDASVRLLFGTGASQFIPASTLTTLSEPVYASVGDFDGDPYIDFAVTYFASDAAGVYRGRADGYFEEPYPLILDDGPTGLVVADFDVDGRDDLVGAAANSSRVYVVRKLSRDCNANGVDDPIDISLTTSVDCNGNGEPDECDLAFGATFDCDANGAIDSCEIVQSPSLDLDSDGTLDDCEFAGNPYCFGDGTGAACPCDPGQAGTAGTGCTNSFGTSGRLLAVGNPSIASDSVTLRASGMLPNAVGLFFQGNLAQSGGLGTALGDGLLCVSQGVIRLEIRFCVNGAMSFGQDVPGDPRISVDGNVPALGATRYYQVWYRDAVSFCTGSTFNLTNGYRIVWTP